MTDLTPDLISLAVSTGNAILALESPKAQTEALKRAIDVSDVFFGVVPDDDGGHTVLIKGLDVLREISVSNKARAVIQGAIVVTCDEEALAMRMVFGDGEVSAPTFH